MYVPDTYRPIFIIYIYFFNEEKSIILTLTNYIFRSYQINIDETIKKKIV